MRWKPLQALAAGLVLAVGAQASASVTNPAIGQLLSAGSPSANNFVGSNVFTYRDTARN